MGCLGPRRSALTGTASAWPRRPPSAARPPGPHSVRYAWPMTVPTFFLTLVGVLLVVLGILAGGNLALVAIGVVALIAAGALEVVGRRRD